MTTLKKIILKKNIEEKKHSQFGLARLIYDMRLKEIPIVSLSVFRVTSYRGTPNITLISGKAVAD